MQHYYPIPLQQPHACLLIINVFLSKIVLDPPHDRVLDVTFIH